MEWRLSGSFQYRCRVGILVKESIAASLLPWITALWIGVSPF
jgi:hypothetical protein